MTIETNVKTTSNYYAIYSYGDNSINNLTLNSTSELSGNGVFSAGIIAYSSNLELRGTIIINNTSNVDQVHGIYSYKGATINSIADIYTNSISSSNSSLNVNGGSLNLSANLSVTASSFYLGENAVVNVSSAGTAIWMASNSVATVLGKLNLVGKTGSGMEVNSGSTFMAMPSSVINIKAANNSFNMYNGNMILSAGVTINAQDHSGEAYLISGRYLTLSSSTSSAELKTKDGVKDNSASTKIDWDNWQPVKDAPQAAKSDEDSQQYVEILQQYDSIIKDSTYKGVNLLKNEKLNVRFNENGSADLNVTGKDMSSNALGLSTIEWSNQGDIAQSLQEIASALKSIRAFTAELGNNYSIITNRQEFTENLINILTEGADKLTLADMNEESANILSLQTRQQLAINSLSLASQASQSILKLF